MFFIKLFFIFSGTSEILLASKHMSSLFETVKIQRSIVCPITFFINSFYNSYLAAKCSAKKSYHLALCLSVYFVPPPLKLGKATTYVTFNSTNLLHLFCHSPVAQKTTFQNILYPL